MINVSEKLKKSCNDNSTVVYREYIVIDNVEVEINATLSATAFKDKSFFGTFNMKTIEFDTENNIDFKKKEFDYYLDINGESMKIGRFIVTDIKDSDTYEAVKITAQDYGLKFAIPYTSKLNYASGTIKLIDVLKECCQNAGVELENTTIDNSNFIVDSNQFPNTLIGDVVSAIAGITGNFATINDNNKLELIFKKETTEIIENYIDLDDKRDTQPITTVVLGNSNIQGQEAIRKDQTLIDKYGEHFLIINDNPFAYTKEKRETLIDEIFNKVKGFSYSSFESKDTFKPYMTLGDLVQFRNKNGDLINSIILKIDKDFSNFTLSAPSIAKASVDYKKNPTPEEIVKRTEIIVNQNSGQIQSIVEQIGDRSSKTTTITQDIEGIQSKITQLEDLTKTVTGNTPIELIDCIKGELYELHIYGNNAITETLYPSQDLYPSNDLYPTPINITKFGNDTIFGEATFGYGASVYDSTLKVQDEKGNITKYNLGIKEVLRQSGDVADEYILKEGKAQVIRRINKDGTIKPTPVIEDLGTMSIFLEEGTNTISMAYIMPVSIKYVLKSEFTDIFATTVELSSAINQSSTQIMLEVNKKVDETELGTKIVQDYKSVQIAWNKIDQSIQFVTENNDAKLQINSANNQKLMEIDKTGQHFFKDNVEFGEMGVQKDRNGNGYIAFNVPVKYESSIENGMAWGITDPEGIFHPVMQLSKFYLGKPNTGNVRGELGLTATDLYVGGGSVVFGGVTLTSDPISNSLTFKNTDTNNIYMEIYPEDREIGTYDELYFLNKIHMFRNEADTETLKIGDDTNYSYMSSDGTISCKKLVAPEGINIAGSGYITQDLTVSNEIWCKKLNQTSIAERKKDFELLENALDIINRTDIYKYHFKEQKENDKKQIGFVIGDKFNYASEITGVNEKGEEMGVDTYSMISVAYKGIQEMQEIIKNQQTQIDELKKEIENLKGGK